MWPYRYADDVPLVTLILNIYIYIYIYIRVCGSNFKHESVIHIQTDRLSILYNID